MDWGIGVRSTGKCAADKMGLQECGAGMKENGGAWNHLVAVDWKRRGGDERALEQGGMGKLVHCQWIAGEVP